MRLRREADRFNLGARAAKEFFPQLFDREHETEAGEGLPRLDLYVFRPAFLLAAFALFRGRLAAREIDLETAQCLIAARLAPGPFLLREFGLLLKLADLFHAPAIAERVRQLDANAIALRGLGKVAVGEFFAAQVE